MYFIEIIMNNYVIYFDINYSTKQTQPTKKQTPPQTPGLLCVSAQGLLGQTQRRP